MGDQLDQLSLTSFDPFSLAPFQEDIWSKAQARRCFTTNKSNVQVDWTDVTSANRATTTSLTSLSEAKTHVAQTSVQTGGLRIISINQNNSWRPLNVTREVFEEVKSATGASAQLLDLALSFNEKSIASKEAFVSAPTFSCNSVCFEITYIFKYAFFKSYDDDRPDSWTIRLTGVYQKYDIAANHSTFILMNPSKDCMFQKRLAQIVSSPDHCAKLMVHPLLVHNILFSTFFTNWRDYLKTYEETVLAVSRSSITQHIEDTLRVDHQVLTSFRSQASCEVVTLLLQNYANQVKAFSQATSILHQRANITAGFIADTFSFKSSHTVHEQTNYMLDDSMTAILGMNPFFEMDSNTRNVVVSPQFWIYLVFCIPVTAGIVFGWLFYRQRRTSRAGGGIMILARC
ncbi:hypothetical protein BDV25DRAFT_132756 [Aspergillus avenaceus]|uniref:CorA-like transporter domain-containing protein n=1 Tax=Aspergillus avenaceus TaxID=36643 RepID=A0A5N6TJX7_ASPAV|nr:hypothetical protein BDV25DRAFT_132756 [Aspergillus avenaceus]